jgi:hypothetical protein
MAGEAIGALHQSSAIKLTAAMVISIQRSCVAKFERGVCVPSNQLPGRV